MSTIAYQIETIKKGTFFFKFWYLKVPNGNEKFTWESQQ